MTNGPSHFARHEKTPREIIQAALSTKPIDETGDSSERAAMRVNRELVAGMVAARKKHDADAAALGPVLITLYTPASFQSMKKMGQAIAAVNKVNEIDGEFSNKLDHYVDDARALVEASDLTAQEKEDYMIGMQRAYITSDSLAAYHDVRSAEEQWRAATVDLYNFALQHAASIKVKNRQILLVGKSLTDQFNARLKNSRDLRSKLRDANQRLVSAQTAGMKKLGIDKSDLGFEKP